MLIVSGELTPLAWGLIWGALYFVIQLILCFKAKKQVIKNLPSVLLIFFIIIGILTHMGIFGKSSVGALAGHQIMGVIIIGISIIAGVGILLAWVIYHIIKKISR